MRNYWSCSSFADWIRKTPKLEVGSSKDWKNWEEEAKKKHPIRYYIAEELLDKIQNVIMYPIDKLYSIKYWFNNRFITQTHALMSNLEKGQWHEFENRVLHCLFDELVNFVEIEKSWKNIICDESAAIKYNAPWYSFGWKRFRVWRSPEAGLDYLDWESQLIMDETWGLTPDDPSYGKLSDQALKAQEISELYHWWKYSRQNRPDPYDASGWSQHCDEKRKESNSFWSCFCREESPEEREKVNEMLKLLHKMEEDFYDEDERMLIRLVKIRRSLWT